MYNRVFFPQEALDLWITEDQVELTDKELFIKAECRKYRIMDAIRVVREVTGTEDVYGIVGKVKSVSFLNELGAELLGSSMLIGDRAYDVVPGFLGSPIEAQIAPTPDPAPPAVSAPGNTASGKAVSGKAAEDAALLAHYLEHNLE